MKRIDFKKALPHVVAIVGFLVISYGYFSPILDGKRLDQHDFKTFKSGAKEIIDYREETGEEPLWTNSMFGGMPAYLISVKYKGNLLQYINRVLVKIGDRPGSYLFMLLLGSYLLFIILGLNPWLSMVGAIAMGFSSYNFIIMLAGHNTKVVAIAYVAPTLAGIFLAFRGKRLLGLALVGVFFSLQINAGHPQITYYTLYIVLFYGISELIFSIKHHKVKSLVITGALVVAVMVLAVMSNYSRLATTLEYGDYSMRSKTELTSIENADENGDIKNNKTDGLPIDYATGWSYGRKETLTLLIPGFRGGSSGYELGEDSETYKAIAANYGEASAKNFTRSGVMMYWGAQGSTSGPVYLGAIVMFLFVLGLFIVEARTKWWIFGVTVLAILLSWGSNLMGLTEFFMHNVPGYNKFRTVSMTLVIPQIVVPILGILALNQLLFKTTDPDKLKRAFGFSAGITGGLSFVLFLIPSLGGNFVWFRDADMGLPQPILSAIQADREAMLRGDALRSALFILVAGGLLYLYKFKNLKLKMEYVVAIVGLLVLIDMWGVNRRFLDEDNFVPKREVEEPFTLTQLDKTIMDAPGLNNRVLNLVGNMTFQDVSSTSYFHQSIGGYHGAKMRRYQDLMMTKLGQEVGYLGYAFNAYFSGQDSSLVRFALPQSNILNMFNTRFIIVANQNRERVPVENPYALGNAWVVRNLILADNADQELDTLGSINLRTTAVTDKKFAGMVEGQDFSKGAGQVKLVDYKPNHLTYEASMAARSLVVFSEMYYEKGWNATIDGNPVDHFRVNYILRGMIIPEGKHTIVFEFKPKSYYRGEKIAMASSLLLILLLGGALFMEFRNGKTEETEEEELIPS